MSKNKKTNKKYMKKTHHEHILDLPDTYAGSIESSTTDMYIYDETEKIMKQKTIEYIPALYKIFDEIIVNAADHAVRLNLDKKAENKVSTIKINIDQENNEISVYNNGDGIDIEYDEDNKMYNPQLIFGELLTSENYDNSNEEKKDKIVGGKNGYGAKLTNIYSKSFIVETVDAYRQKKYVQKFSDNMYTVEKPKITTYKPSPYTKITFQPDLKYFKLSKLTDDIVDMMKKRVYDMTACTHPTVSVYLNDKKINVKDFEKYVDLYIGGKTDKVRFYEKIDDRWEIVVTESPDHKFEHISFVNSICTFKGGKHVETVSTKISNKLSKYLSEKGVKRKKYTVKPAYVKDNLMIFIKSTIVNPSFDSQTKEYLTTQSKKFGSVYDPTDKFIEKIAKSTIVDKIIEFCNFKDKTSVAKIGGGKKSYLRGIPKLEDAENAGGSKSALCTLILTEGDSAKTFAMSGRAIVGSENYGVFPLKGKLLNVRDAKIDQLSKNQEIKHLQEIIGLKQFEDKDGITRKVYKDINELRYGKILILTDADVDGTHIKGLLINFIYYFWPELIELAGENFVQYMITPIVKVNKNKKSKSFYTLTDYNNWKEQTEDSSKWKIKYYKGLGTSTPEEAKEYFAEIENNIKKYYSNGEESREAIDLAFNKKKADERKEWLKSYDENNIIDNSKEDVLVTEFVNKDLIHFSQYDNHRSIPSVIDGFKPSQRKVIYASLSKFKTNTIDELKVSQLAGFVSEHSAYHHGETSLCLTIVGLAQDYVSSNNINLLRPEGQFGSRLQGGKDSASPRYIFTGISQQLISIINKDDNDLLEFLEDDGLKIEPRFYVPIIPMILVNGTKGIGTGFSTEIPCFNPIEIINNVKRMIDGEEPEEMKPWYKGFTGQIEKIDDKKYMTFGKYEIENKNTMKITELPIGKWTEDYIKDLEEKFVWDSSKDHKSKNLITTYINRSCDKNVDILLKLPEKIMNKFIENEEKLLETFNLTSTISMTNMHLHSHDGSIKLYNNEIEILKEYYDVRFDLYVKRKEHLLNKYKDDLDKISSKFRFIKGFIDGEIVLVNKEEEEVYEKLEEMKFKKRESNNSKTDNYDYLLDMKIRTLTKKRMEELQKEKDEKTKIVKQIESTSPGQMWKNDLDDLLKKYETDLKAYLQRKQNSSVSKSAKSTKTKSTKSKSTKKV